MLDLFIVILLLYVSYKLTSQENLILSQNDLIESLQETQNHCQAHIKKLERLYDTILKDKSDKDSK